MVYCPGYGVAVDVWALGVILYILLCGFAPFRSRDRDQEELFKLIKQAQLHFPSPYWDSISESETNTCILHTGTNVINSDTSFKLCVLFSFFLWVCRS